MLRVLRSEVSQVNTSQQLAELQKSHPVLFILVDDGELDLDWRATYMKLAYERILRARYLYTTNPDVLKVKLSPIPSPLTVWEWDYGGINANSQAAHVLPKLFQ